MKKVLSSLCALAALSCSNGQHDSSSTAGAPHQFSMLCESNSGDSSFRIYEGQGLLRRYGQESLKFRCEQIVGFEGEFVAHPSRMLWSCFELDKTNGYEVSVYKNLELGTIRASVVPTKGGFQVAKLSCQQ